MKVNLFPLNFEFEKFQIESLTYSQDKLDELRDEYNGTHSFFRNNDKIYVSNKTGTESLNIGNEIEELDLFNNNVSLSLIKHIFFKTFLERFRNYTPSEFYPFKFYSKQDRDNIIYKLIPESYRTDLQYKKLIEIQLREYKVDDKYQIGFLINIRRNWIFNISCEQMNNEGFDLIGREVLKTEFYPGTESVLAPNEEFLGQVISVDNNMAKVNSNNGEVNIDLKRLFLKKTHINIYDYIGFIGEESLSNKVYSHIKNRKEEILNPKNLNNEVQKIATQLFCEKVDGNLKPILFQNKDGFSFRVQTNMQLFENSMVLQNPSFIFDPAGTQRAGSSDSGLSNYGPYDSAQFSPKSPQFLCICHKNERGAFSRFIANLLNGIPDSKWYKSGLQKKYDLHNINHSIEEISDYNYDEYWSKLIGENENKPDFVIIEIPAYYKKLRPAENPYFKLKAKLLPLEIPVQFITTEIMRGSKDIILNQIGLQVYAKLGGTPWVLPASNSVDRELVIGIGHSWIRSNQFSGADAHRIVGITTIMSGDGQYLMADRIRDVEFDDYFDALLNSLDVALKNLIKQQAWRTGDTIRLVFHIFKPIKNVEFEVVKNLVRTYNEYKVQFAFVTVSHNHPFKLFDPMERGVSSFRSSELKGTFIPKRGSNLFLDDFTCIVQMYGAAQLKMSKHGMSKPILVKILIPTDKDEYLEFKDMLFTDLNYIVQQIYSFTYLSWRSFLPADKPATMKYSELIAQQLGKLRQVENWDADSLKFKLKATKWFL